MSDQEEILNELEALELRLLTEIWHLETILHSLYKKIDASSQNFDQNFKN